jgi:hypothetical protein
MNKVDLDNRFTYHAPNPEQPQIYKSVRDQARDLVEYLDAVAPDGRELSLAVTHIEEAVFWANAAIARKSD